MPDRTAPFGAPASSEPSCGVAADEEHVGGRALEDVGRHGAEERSRDGRPAAGADDDQAGSTLLGGPQQRGRGVALQQQRSADGRSGRLRDRGGDGVAGCRPDGRCKATEAGRYAVIGADGSVQLPQGFEAAGWSPGSLVEIDSTDPHEFRLRPVDRTAADPGDGTGRTAGSSD